MKTTTAMKALLLLARMPFGATALAGPASSPSTALVDLTDAQLEQVTGGGGKPPIGPSGFGAGTLSGVINAANGPALPDPDGGKAGVTGNMG